jgi:phosphopantetheinyl transferase
MFRIHYFAVPAHIDPSHLQSLDAYERVMCDRLVDPTRRREQQMSYIAQRRVIGDQFNVPPDQIRIARHSGTRPRCIDYPTFLYNTSHSRGHIVIVSGETICGVDIELVGPRHSMIIAEQFGNSPSSNHAAATLWTRVESWMKFSGTGIDDLPNITVSNDTIYHHGFDVPDQHDISHLLPGTDLVGSIVTGRSVPPRFTDILRSNT